MNRVIRLFAALCLLSGAYARAADSLEGKPIAYHLFGGSGAWNKTPAGNSVTDYEAWSKVISPQMAAQGYERTFWHNPGGQFALGWMPDWTDMPRSLHESRALAAKSADTRLVWVNQWQLAEQSNCKFADRRKLKAAFDEHVRHGIKEVIVYVGSPDPLPDPYKDGLAVLEVYMSLGPQISLGFDVLGDAPWLKGPKLNACRRLCEELQKRGHRVYLEPRVPGNRTEWPKYIDGTIAEARLDTTGPQAVKFAKAAKFGEVLQLSSSSASERELRGWPEGVTPVVRLWREQKAADVRRAKSPPTLEP